MNEPGQGPDPIAAARNVDQAAKDAVGAAIGQKEEDQRRNDTLPPFNNHTQGLAGLLMAEEDRLKRQAADLELREQDAAAIEKAAIDAAEAVYNAAVKAAASARRETSLQITAEVVDLEKARDAIRASVTALTK